MEKKRITKATFQKWFTKDNIKRFVLMNIGTLFAAGSVFFFKAPNNLTTGGVSGIGIILHVLFPQLPVGAVVSAMNVVLLLLGFLFLGKKLGAATVYCTILFSGFLWGMEYVLPLTQSITGDVLLDVMFGSICSAVGASLLFNLPASTGGTDIISMIVKKYSNFNISTCMLIVEFSIAVFSGFAVGWKTAAYSILCLIIQVAAVNVIIDNLNYKKQVTIITTKPKAVCDYITNELHRGATVVRGLGAYTGEPRYIVYTILNPSQAIHLKKKTKEFDEHCFFMISNTSDIIGKGFRQSALDFADDKTLIPVPHVKHEKHEQKPAVAPHEVPDFDLATLKSLGIEVGDHPHADLVTADTVTSTDHADSVAPTDTANTIKGNAADEAPKTQNK